MEVRLHLQGSPDDVPQCEQGESGDCLGCLNVPLGFQA